MSYSEENTGASFTKRREVIPSHVCWQQQLLKHLHLCSFTEEDPCACRTTLERNWTLLSPSSCLCLRVLHCPWPWAFGPWSPAEDLSVQECGEAGVHPSRWSQQDLPVLGERQTQVRNSQGHLMLWLWTATEGSCELFPVLLMYFSVAVDLSSTGWAKAECLAQVVTDAGTSTR